MHAWSKNLALWIFLRFKIFNVGGVQRKQTSQFGQEEEK